MPNLPPLITLKVKQGDGSWREFKVGFVDGDGEKRSFESVKQEITQELTHGHPFDLFLEPAGVGLLPSSWFLVEAGATLRVELKSLSSAASTSLLAAVDVPAVSAVRGSERDGGRSAPTEGMRKAGPSSLASTFPLNPSHPSHPTSSYSRRPSLEPVSAPISPPESPSSSRNPSRPSSWFEDAASAPSFPPRRRLSPHTYDTSASWDLEQSFADLSTSSETADPLSFAFPPKGYSSRNASRDDCAVLGSSGSRRSSRSPDVARLEEEAARISLAERRSGKEPRRVKTQGNISRSYADAQASLRPPSPASSLPLPSELAGSSRLHRLGTPAPFAAPAVSPHCPTFPSASSRPPPTLRSVATHTGCLSSSDSSDPGRRSPHLEALTSSSSNSMGGKGKKPWTRLA